MKRTKSSIIFSLILLTTIVLSCRSYEKIGKFKYQTTTETIFITDYGGIEKEIKSYKLKNKHQVGVVLKTYLGYNQEEDTVLSTGYGEFDGINKQLIVKEYFFYGYKEYIRSDSLLKVFKQFPNGELKLILHKKYYNGAVKTEHF